MRFLDNPQGFLLSKRTMRPTYSSFSPAAIRLAHGVVIRIS
jgi:hypothetical protein